MNQEQIHELATKHAPPGFRISTFKYGLEKLVEKGFEPTVAAQHLEAAAKLDVAFFNCSSTTFSLIVMAV